MTKELTAQLAQAQTQLNQLKVQLASAEKEITKWKYKFNSKNADYILLYQELKTKKSWPWFYWLALVLALFITFLTLKSWLSY